MMKTTYTLYIDTKKDKSQSPSKFLVRIPDDFMRSYMRYDKSVINEWYISIKTFSILNSFSNISLGINDLIVIYTAKAGVAIANDPTSIEEIDPTLFDVNEVRLTPGNPNVFQLAVEFNKHLQSHGITAEYNKYNSTYDFEVNFNHPRKKYLHFHNTADLFGMDTQEVISVYLTTHTPKSSNNVNLMADRLLKFHLNSSHSDFKIRNTSYSNMRMPYDFALDNMMFFLLPITVDPYQILHYDRVYDNQVEIELYKNSIKQFQIDITNQDDQPIEGLDDWLMVLEFVHIQRENIMKQMLDLLKQIYLWVATYFSKKLI